MAYINSNNNQKGKRLRSFDRLSEKGNRLFLLSFLIPFLALVLWGFFEFGYWEFILSYF